MTTSLKRAGTVLLSVLLLCTLALSAGAASKLRVGVKFWKTGSDKESMARTFLALVHGTAPDSVPDSRVSDTAGHIGMSMGLFKRLLDISLNSPNSWVRAK